VISGILVERTFLGRQTRYVVEALGQKLIVSTSEPPLPNELSLGKPVRLGWARGDAQLLAMIHD